MKNVEMLKVSLTRVELSNNGDPTKDLNERKRKELEFHDLDRDLIRVKALNSEEYNKFYGNKKFYDGVYLSSNYVDKWIESNSTGKVFLDYACGNGTNAIKAAKAGAALSIGIDISRVSIENAKMNAKFEGVTENTVFIQADAENTNIPGSQIDIIICSGVLHHLDLSFAFPELRRILAPGGKILAVEALGYNPLINLYRLLTPSMRTDWEKNHILSLKEIAFAKYFFDIGEIKYWHIMSILGAFSKKILPLLNFVDYFLTKIPIIKLLSWMFTFELIKKKE